MTPSPPDPQAPIFTIHGLRAHATQELLSNAAPILALGFAGVLGRDPMRTVVYGSASILVGILVFVKLVRSRIAVHVDRIEVRGWDSLLAKHRTVPLSHLRKVARHGTTIRFAWDDEDRGVRHLKIAMSTAVAEDFFDQLLQVVEDDPALRGRVEEKGSGRFRIRAD